MELRSYDTSHEWQPKALPEFEFNQPDGSVARLDFSAPGMMGDFAFYHENAPEDQQNYWLYHTGTQVVFEHFVTAMVQSGNATEQFEKLCGVLDEYSATMTTTTESQSRFGEYELRKLSEQIDCPLERLELNASGHGDDELWITPQGNSTRLEMDRSWDYGERLEYGVTVPHDQAWQFLAGMIWRSYSDDERPWPQNSRHATSASLSKRLM